MFNTLVAIPIYKKILSDSETISLVQCLKVLGKHKIYIFCPNNLDITEYEKIFNANNVSFLIERFDDRFFLGIKGYNELMLTVDFYQRFSAFEYMLIYQLDAYVFDDQLEFWCDQKYDYIGAPWFEGYASCKPDSKLMPNAGNGGFSLRKIKSFIDILNNPSSDILIKKHVEECINEDGFFSVYASNIDESFKVAPPQVALKFSFECMPEKLYEMNNKKLPFGCHAWEKYDPYFWDQFMELRVKGLAISEKVFLQKRGRRHFLNNVIKTVKSKFLNKV